jgi:hypothetical protein
MDLLKKFSILSHFNEDLFSLLSLMGHNMIKLQTEICSVNMILQCDLQEQVPCNIIIWKHDSIWQCVIVCCYKMTIKYQCSNIHLKSTVHIQTVH